MKKSRLLGMVCAFIAAFISTSSYGISATYLAPGWTSSDFITSIVPTRVIAFDNDNDLFVVNTSDPTPSRVAILKLTAASGYQFLSSYAQYPTSYRHVIGLDFDNTSSLYVAEVDDTWNGGIIRGINAATQTLAGDVMAFTDHRPTGVDADASGTIFYSGRRASDHTWGKIFKIDTNVIPAVRTELISNVVATGIAVSKSGDIFISTSDRTDLQLLSNSIYRFPANDFLNPELIATFDALGGELTFDVAGNLYMIAGDQVNIVMLSGPAEAEPFPWEIFMPAILNAGRQKTPNTLPDAAFTYNCSGLTCNFTDTSTDIDGSIVSWAWNFGDGRTSSLRNPSHTYASTGTYTVRLTVTDNSGGSNTTSRTVTVSAANVLPTAAFTFNCTVLTCNFTDSSTDIDGNIVSWAWNFGDGGLSSLRNPSHTYASLGTYSVRLTVTDNSGASNTTTRSVTVQDSDLVKLQLLLGDWVFGYTIISTFTHVYYLNSIEIVSSGPIISGIGEFGDLVVAALIDDSSLGYTYSLLDPGTIIDRFYIFDLSGNTVTGQYFQVDSVTGNITGGPYAMIGTRFSTLTAVSVQAVSAPISLEQALNTSTEMENYELNEVSISNAKFGGTALHQMAVKKAYAKIRGLK